MNLKCLTVQNAAAAHNVHMITCGAEMQPSRTVNAQRNAEAYSWSAPELFGREARVVSKAREPLADVVRDRAGEDSDDCPGPDLIVMHPEHKSGYTSSCKNTPRLVVC